MRRHITQIEHKELMDFLRIKAKNLFEHEVLDAEEKGNLPKNVYQGRFALQQCMAFEKDGTIVYRIYSQEFIKFSREILPLITQKKPNIFRDTDARDILKELNTVSGYTTFNKTENDYLSYLSNYACVYVVLKRGDNYDDKVLRIDLCRGIQTDRKDSSKFEFRGGLLHVAKHFNIFFSNAIDSTFDIEHFIGPCTDAFIKITPDDSKEKYTIYLSCDDHHSLQLGFYKEKKSNVYYIDTLFPINNNKIKH